MGICGCPGAYGVVIDLMLIGMGTAFLGMLTSGFWYPKYQAYKKFKRERKIEVKKIERPKIILIQNNSEVTCERPSKDQKSRIKIS